MRHFTFFCLLTGFFVVSPAAGGTEYHLGGTDGVPWQQVLSTGTAGAYLVLDADGRQTGSIPVRTAPQKAGADTLIDYSGTSIQSLFIDPLVNLARGTPDDLSNINSVSLMTGGGVSVTYGASGIADYLCYFAAQRAPANYLMLDGDPSTAQFQAFTQDPTKAPGIPLGYAFQEAIIFDFGADLPINRIRFYPRLSRTGDAQLIRNFSAPRPDPGSFGTDSFARNFVAWFEIYVGDNSLPYQHGPCSRVPGRRWIGLNDPWLKVLHSTRENLDVVTDLRFSTQSIRYLTFRAYPLRNWEIAEFEVYGEGYVNVSTLITEILDFGKPINWSKIRWSGKAPKGTRVEIRTRTGNTPDPNLYFVRNVNRDLERISLEDYMRIDALSRLPTVYDVENWSFWSPPYDFVAGLRDEFQPASFWEDGTPMLSPGPSRYLQIAIKFFSSPYTTPRLDQLSLQFGETPSAQEILGEIWPNEVDTFTPTTFTYIVLPTFAPDDLGFDRLEILTHTRIENIRSIVLDGVEVDRARYPPKILDDRIVIAFPKMQGEADSFKQLEVVFDAPVFRFGTEFSGWVFDSEDPARIKQRVEPGNATFRFSGNSLSVKTPVGGDLLIDVQVTPRTITPNGDGINDWLTISYKLREVEVSRPMVVRIYDLAGRLVAELSSLSVKSGEFRQEWDGRNTDGQLVPPGIYLYNLTLDLEDKQGHTGFISVAY